MIENSVWSPMFGTFFVPMAGADEADADNIAKAIEARPWPSYEERMAVFSPAGPWKPSGDPFKKGST
jgi:hypothetical protein